MTLENDYPPQDYSEEVALVEKLQAGWEVRRKDAVIRHQSKDGKKTTYQVATEIEGLLILSQLIVGPRAGLTEVIIAVDPSREIVLDRLLLRQSTKDGYLFSLAEIRRELKSGTSSIDSVIVGAFKDMDESVKSKPEHYGDYIRSIPTQSFEPPGVWRGGAWNQKSS